MKKIFSALTVAFTFFALCLTSVHAQALHYPIPELDNCRDAKECYLFCEIPANKGSCWSWGKYRLGAVLGDSTSTSDQQVAREHGITFPIPQLGNCNSITECKAFCGKPENRQSCSDFARSRGLGQYKRENELLERAKQELGCDSIETCKALCNSPENRDRCRRFAEKNEPPELKEKKQAMLKMAKQVLGCDSFESCKALCENPATREKCQNFAQQYMPQEMKQRLNEQQQQGQGALPCTSEESCKAFCDDPAHQDQCQQFKDQNGTRIEIHQDKHFTCNSEEECRLWCQQNPDKCPGFKQSQDYQPTIQKFAQPTNLQPTFFKNYSFPTYSPQGNQPTHQEISPYQTYPPQQYTPPAGQANPADYCVKNPGCFWTGSTCQCPH